MTDQQHLSHLAILTISGEQAATFLQGQLTCDVNALEHGQSTPGGYCNHQGRLVATFHLLKWKNDFLMILAHDLLNDIQTSLQKFGAFSQVTVTPAEDSAVFSTFKSSNNEHPFIPIDANRGYIIAPHSKDKSLDNQDSINKWQEQNIASGLAHVEKATQLLWTPQMIDLEKIHGVSFTKGCYLGQEVVARTQHLGKLKRHLYQATVNKALNPGDAIKTEEEQPAGHVVCSTQKNGDNLILCVLHQAMLEKTLAVGNNTITNITRCHSE